MPDEASADEASADDGGDGGDDGDDAADALEHDAAPTAAGAKPGSGGGATHQTPELDAAATKLQAIQRGNSTRGGRPGGASFYTLGARASAGSPE